MKDALVTLVGLVVLLWIMSNLGNWLVPVILTLIVLYWMNKAGFVEN